jgi:AraC-like DNA-binding protein
MKREIRDKRDKLREGSKRLRELALDCGFEQSNYNVRVKQEEQFKRFKFYDGMIKASEKVKEVGK